MGKSLQIISKISKFCNLRCTYCYEFPDLGNRARMSLDDIGRMFANLRRHADQADDIDEIVFYWQGGEPLLIKPDYYLAIADLSRNAFAGSVPVVHALQTNLTVLTDAWLDFLEARRFFTHVSVSFDVVGEERVDTRGRASNVLVMRNMQKLIDRGIDFGAIAVLARHNRARVRDIYRFYDSLGAPMRVLPFYVSASAEQVEAHGLGAGEIVDSLRALFDEWMVSEAATPVEPLATYFDYAVAFIQGAATRSMEKAIEEDVFLVTPSGETWGLADLYVPGAAYGDIFTDDMSAILGGVSRRRSRRDARLRVGAICATCPYFGACPGHGVAFASPDERVVIERDGCMVRPVLDHIVDRLTQTKLVAEIANVARHGARETVRVAI